MNPYQYHGRIRTPLNVKYYTKILILPHNNSVQLKYAKEISYLIPKSYSMAQKERQVLKKVKILMLTQSHTFECEINHINRSEISHISWPFFSQSIEIRW